MLWLGYPIVSPERRRFRFFRQGSLGAGTVPWQDGVLTSDVCEFTRIWTSKTGPSYRQNRLLSRAADCWGQEAGCSPTACFCFGKREELGWSKAAAEPEAGFSCCSTCCSSCLSSPSTGGSNRNLSSSGLSFPISPLLSSHPSFPQVRSSLSSTPAPHPFVQNIAYNADKPWDVLGAGGSDIASCSF